ncbi:MULTISPECIES: UvrD-helicase domain-containing protein [unclassified Dyella]|uniref:UvrD-helicase domain-containing protein n=1 Tax=Dyella sp. ASV21 TaxID=2795114 RepID=UPI0018EDCC6C|nr:MULTISPECIES: UvrD-helicase domain-containing protein [unclassified Dyella]
MDEDLARTLAQFVGKGYVIAPAGYGKTHLIASAVKAASKRQLVLTHTYAGVHAIKKKMQSLAVPSSNYQIDTIASWALRLCLYFPKTSKWTKEYPEAKDWGRLYEACAGLLERPFVERLVRCSYAGIYVDEYQDCSTQQHLLISALANLLPCRLLGDPMQAIFDFDDQPINWEQQIYPHYKLLGELTKPWRWHIAGATELGDWLDDVGKRLRAGQQISLAAPLPKGIKRVSVDLTDFTNMKRLNFFYPFLDHDEAVIAIHAGDQKSKNKTHKLAQSLGGKFSSIEEVEGKDLFNFIKKLEAAKEAGQRLCLVIEFCKKCCNGVGEILSAATKRGELAKATRATKYPDVLHAANQYLACDSTPNLVRLINAIQGNPQTSIYRRDLLYRLLSVLRVHQANEGLSLSESAHRYQRDFRHSGRPIRHNKLIGTTLLVKGLEYPHAIVLEADAMSPKDLYVALTRGAKTVTIVSLKTVLPG